MRPAVKKILIALLFANAAYADRVAERPLFEIDHLSTQTKDVKKAQLFESGNWSGPAGSGRLSDADMKRVRDELKAAKWTVTTAKIRCMAISANYEQYFANGKMVLERHTCDGKTLDEASQKLVTDATALLAPAFAR